MDVGVKMSQSSKEQKLCESLSMNIISNLPDHVLHRIISFLSTRDIIRLSVLSKRWQYLWKSIPNIDLEDETNWKFEFFDIFVDHLAEFNPELKDIVQQRQRATNFLEFVNRVLTLHDASDIKRLRLKLRLPEKFPRLNSWLQIVVNHKVEEFDLHLRCKPLNELPCCLFTCHSLVVLNINADFNNISLNPPPFTSFLILKKLTLKGVSFLDNVSIQRLFSGCPVLEELVLSESYLEDIENITISSPTLKSLTLKFVAVCMIEISAINLACLNYTNKDIVNISLSELPSLDTASLRILTSEVPVDEFDFGTDELYPGICNVKAMRITYVVLLSIINASDNPDHIPTFYKLIRLEVSQLKIPCYNELMRFLMKIPNLEHLELRQDFCYDDAVYEMVEIVPSCFNSSLKIFSISCFAVNRAVKELVGFILKNATVLQRLIIDFSRSILSKDKESLFMLPKVSESCVIELRDN